MLDPDANDTYKCLAAEQAQRIKVKEVLMRVKAEMQNRLRTLLNDTCCGLCNECMSIFKWRA